MNTAKFLHKTLPLELEKAAILKALAQVARKAGCKAHTEAYRYTEDEESEFWLWTALKKYPQLPLDPSMPKVIDGPCEQCGGERDVPYDEACAKCRDQGYAGEDDPDRPF